MTDAEIVAWHREKATAFTSRADQCAARGYDDWVGAYRDDADAHTRAADAIEENARLRDMLDDTAGALEALCGERPAWQYLLDEVRAALRKPDAAK